MTKYLITLAILLPTPSYIQPPATHVEVTIERVLLLERKSYIVPVRRERPLGCALD